jgi:hypothetical protein
MDAAEQQLAALMDVAERQLAATWVAALPEQAAPT